jgi:hypothetical protein
MIGPQEQRLGDGQAQGFGGLEIDYQLEFCRAARSCPATRKSKGGVGDRNYRPGGGSLRDTLLASLQEVLGLLGNSVRNHPKPAEKSVSYLPGSLGRRWWVWSQSVKTRISDNSTTHAPPAALRPPPEGSVRCQEFRKGAEGTREQSQRQGTVQCCRIVKDCRDS